MLSKLVRRVSSQRTLCAMHAWDALYPAGGCQPLHPNLMRYISTSEQTEEADPFERVEVPYEAITKIVDIGEKLTYIEAQNDQFYPTAFMQDFLNNVHTNSELPWWMAIVWATVFFRSLSFPLFVWQTKNTIGLMKARPEMEYLQKAAEAAYNRGASRQSFGFPRKMRDIFRRHGCHPFYSFLPLFINLPTFMGFYTALSSLAEVKLPSLTREGALWFTDLSAADPYHVLPMLNAVAILLAIQFGGTQEQSTALGAGRTRMVRNIGRAFAVLSVVATWNMPSVFFLYWIPSVLWTLLSARLVRSPLLRKRFNIPSMAEAQEQLATQRELFKKVELQKLVGKPVKLYDYNPVEAAKKSTRVGRVAT